VGRKDGRQRGEKMAVVGEKRMAIDTCPEEIVGRTVGGDGDAVIQLLCGADREIGARLPAVRDPSG